MQRRSKPSIQRVSVLGSGKVREKDFIYQQATKLGRALAQENLTVFHGGYKGVMEAVAKGCDAGGGYNTAVMIRGGTRKSTEWAYNRIGMPTWQSRLFKLIEMGDAYIFLDGASGTLAELFVVLEMTNRGLLSKPIIILGKKLTVLLRSLAKDPHFDLPPAVHFSKSISQVTQLLNNHL